MWIAKLSDGTEHETAVYDQSDEGVAEAVEYIDGWIKNCSPGLSYELEWRD